MINLQKRMELLGAPTDEEQEELFKNYPVSVVLLQGDLAYERDRVANLRVAGVDDLGTPVK